MVVLAVAAVAIVAASSGAVVADDGNETAAENAIIHDFAGSDVVLRDVTFDGDRAYVTVDADSSETVTVSDAGKAGQGQFDVATTTVSDEETIEIRIQDDEIVTIGTPQDGYQYTGDVGLLTIIQHEPTTVLLQWAAVSGMIGPVIALSMIVTNLRRKHSNTYKELTSEERIKVEKDPVDGFVDKIKRTIAENRTLFVFLGILTMYFSFWFVGRVPGPVGIWNGMSDAMRVITVGALLTCLLSIVPVYMLARRLWNPEREFVVSCDARDVIEEALGADGGLAEMVEAVEDMKEGDDQDGESYGIAIYSGAPDRIADMTVDGGMTDSKAPGGPCHFVQDFNPAKNEATGTWPGVADDIELISERSKIDGNREILRDESKMLRSLLSAMPAISIASDTGAARSVDRELRQALTVDESPTDNILERAASGTRFEGYWSDSDEETVEYEEFDESDDEATEKESPDQ
ncbi:hypothetical protein [Natronobacterium gregoryi]|uniref:Uncharacterized protein n=1 Tax=Natronobacterium gregoryi (strain ATCC 43098 / DSM 3393 / CCM 3738 / CIP 104747 / IAM 13177 / JCM 8860 / NBRC 102187 / NCIMB 2189 / SP2) TaxID=797304 RepID=L9XYN7_NATGS|nr:hypothetical protein [Natronobacterium gregoryi]ELY66949.1 hypothetical protein C490_11953 [Natronobacterium gregoryi SP2]PLK21196.1 hypothetical protein CYV19_05095 [Natronobacterium gregoryi SP2]